MRDQEQLARLFRWTVGIGLAIIAAATSFAFFAVDVCDQQLSSKGNAVEVCRHLQASDPPVVAVALILLGALGGVFFTEISAFGVTVKRHIQTVDEKAEEARAQATDAAAKAGMARMQATDAAAKAEAARAEATDAAAKAEAAREAGETYLAQFREAEGDRANLGELLEKFIEGERDSFDREEPIAPRKDGDGEAEADTKTETVDQLAEEYNWLRLTMPSGSKRTAAMESVVKRMIPLLADAREFDVDANLTSLNRGLRLAAYAYLYSKPDPIWTRNLVSALLDLEDKPFGQYWALRALTKQCDTDPTAIDTQTRRRLVEELQPRLPQGSDRAHVLRRALDACAPP
jgi:hypothetical protein